MRRGRQGLALIAGTLAVIAVMTSAEAAPASNPQHVRTKSYGSVGDKVFFSSPAPGGTLYVGGWKVDRTTSGTPVFERITTGGRVMWRKELANIPVVSVPRAVATDPSDHSLVSIVAVREGSSLRSLLVRISANGKTVATTPIDSDAGTPPGGGFAASVVGYAKKRLIVVGLGGGTFGGRATSGLQNVVLAYDGTTRVATQFLGSGAGVPTLAPPAIAPNGDIAIAYIANGSLRVARLKPDLTVLWDKTAMTVTNLSLAISVGFSGDGKTVFASVIGMDTIIALHADGTSFTTAPIRGSAYAIVPTRKGALFVGETKQAMFGQTPVGDRDGFIAELRSDTTLVGGHESNTPGDDAFAGLQIKGSLGIVTGAVVPSGTNAQDFVATYRLPR